jgi:hypothetical protein
MSFTDKSRLDALHALMEEPEANDVVDTINELLEVFETYPEGTDIAILLANKQPLDSDLTAIAGISETDGFLKKTSGTWGLDTNTYLTDITKSMVESVLTGDISSHTHSQYLESSDLTGYATETFVTTQGYLTSESDPIFVASDAYGITGTNISNWNDAYG